MKIMVVQIGKDNTIHIKKDVLDKMFLSIKQYNYETGGIIGVNEEGVISAFQFDETQSLNPFEYCPNVDFLNQVINEKWAKENMEFIGFVHSHLNNCKISQQDIKYVREVLKENICLEYILIGVINFGDDNNHMGMYLVDLKEITQLSYMVV